MDLNVISKLTKLAGREYLCSEINSLMDEDQIEEFETPYAYYGEFLERQEGYETEKMISYILLKDELKDTYINLYQINDIEEKIQSLTAGDNPWLRMVDAVFNKRFNPVTLKDYILFLKMANIFNKRLPEEVRYNFFMENINDIIQCKFMSDDVTYIFRSLNGIVSKNKTVCFFQSLFEKKPTEKKIADMCKLGISAVDIQIIYSLLVIGGRKTTNAVIEAFKQLFSCEDEWNDFEKSYVKEYWKKKTPTNYNGECYPYLIIFNGAPKNLNNLFFMTDVIDSCILWNVSLFKDSKLISEWKSILHHFESNDEIFLTLISEITRSVEMTEALLSEFPNIDWVLFINKYPGCIDFLLENNFISVEQVAEMKIDALKTVIEMGFDKTFELLSIFREKRHSELFSLFHRINYKHLMTSRKLVDLVAQLLSEISMEEFDEFLLTLLFNDTIARNLFSEVELKSLVESYREICIYYNNRSRKMYNCCSSSDVEWLFDIYATAEEKKAKQDAEEEKKLQDIISDIRRKMADNKNGIFGVEWRDFRYCCYYSDLYIPIWNRLKENMSIPTEICVCSQDEYFEMVENISYYARNLKFSIPEFQDILNKLKIMED